MKKIIFFWALLTVFFSFDALSEEAPKSTFVMPQPVDEVVIPKDAPNTVQIYVTKIFFDQQKKLYQAQEKFSGSLEVYYPGKEPVSDISVSMYIGTSLNEKGFPGQKIARIDLGTFDFEPNQKKIVPFSFDLPNFALPSFNTYTEFFSATNARVGFYNGRDIFELQGGKEFIKIKDAYIFSPDSNKSYFLSQGPGVGSGTPNKSLQLVIKLETLFPDLQVRMDVFRDAVSETPLITESKNILLQNGAFAFDLPTITEPGVYAGVLTATSATSELAPIHFRWIVGGAMAKIRTMTVGDALNVSLVGTPHPSTYGETSQTVGDQMYANLVVDFRGTTFFTSKMLLLGYEKSLTIPLADLKLLPLGGDLTAQVVMDNGQVLTSQTVYVARDMKTLGMYGAGVFVLLLLLSIFFRKRHSKIALIVFVFFLGAFDSHHVEALTGPYGATDLGHGECAAEGYQYPTLSLSEPAENDRVICNEPVRLVGEMIHGACENTGIGGFSSQYRFINTDSDAHTEWTALSPEYVSGVPGGGHSWNPIAYELNEEIIAPADVQNYNAIQFFVVHSIGCGASLYYYQPIESVCCQGDIPTNATFCPDDHGNAQRTSVLGCTDAIKCEYECNNGFKLVNGMCVPIVCTGADVATNGVLCAEDDQNLSGHVDINRVRRANQAACTAPEKCEWHCPADKPVFCEAQNTCVVNLDSCSCPAGQQKCADGTCSATCTQCATSAPSELKTNIDYPIIQCNSIDTTKTHFRYKITKVGASATDTFVSDLFTVGTAVQHPSTFPQGEYRVECFYGTAVNDIAAMTLGTCTKTMTVKDGDVQGCSRIYGYKGSTLSDEMLSQSSFDASFRCGSRLASVGITNPYRLAVGSQAPAFLQYDAVSTELFNTIPLGPVSTQTQNYTFNTGSDVTCAVKVGDGYSTNNTCKIRTCVGSDCARPQTFVVTPSANQMCTRQDTITYDIGCNDASADYARCAEWFNSTGDRTIKVNNTIQTLTCQNTTPPGAFGPVRTCAVTLPSGGVPVTLFAGDANSFQTTVYTLSRDVQAPTGTLEYFTNYSAGTKLQQSQYQFWQKQSVTAVITCTDLPGQSDGSSCACAPSLQNDPNGYWSLGQRNTDTNVGPDIMTYSRILFNNSSLGSPVTVVDTAGNIGSTHTPQIGVDTVPPKVTASISGSNVTLNVSDSLEGGSGLWKGYILFNASNNIITEPELPTRRIGSVYYRIVPKSDALTQVFDNNCSVPQNNGYYFKYGETGAAMTQNNVVVNIGNADTYVLAYCTQDNAGNVTRGVYPAEPTGCFSASNMSTVPTLSTYKTPLQANITANKFGYSLSEDAANATCFRGILSSNITTLITNQYNPSTSTTLNWSTPATLKNTSTANTNGYYYHRFTTANNANHTNNTVSLPNTSPTGTGQRVVLVDGGNIQINQNIDYSGSDKTLVLIARRTNNSGGNIFIHPNVTRIDAILIADGSLMNAETTATTTTSSTTIRNWIDHANILTNRLTINGRIYSFNTRGGSLAISGTNLVKLITNTGKYFNGSQLVTTATPSLSAQSDLERLRVILDDGNAQCTTHVQYNPLSVLPAILERPTGYSGGSCSF